MGTISIQSTIGSLLLLILFSAVECGVLSHPQNYRNQAAGSLSKRAPVVSSNLTTGWSHLGCYTDDVNSRTLYQSATTAQDLTENSCIAYCSQNGFAYAGAEYGTECYCGKLIAASGKKTSLTDCSMDCAGALGEACGAASRINIFHLDSDVIPAAGPAHNAGPSEWGYIGCYTDSVASRSLKFGGQSEGGYTKLTNALCTAACQQDGHLFAGTEYSGECYCGDTLSSDLLAPDGLSGCNMVCNGNASEYCGGANRLDVFGYHMRSVIAPGWTSLGCYTDSVQSRSLRYGVQVAGGYTNMTVENCQNACQVANYQIAGVEYAQECFCDSAVQKAGGPALDGNAQCNMACKGDGSEICGGPNRLNIYQFVSGSSSSTTSIAATTTAASTTAAMPGYPTDTGSASSTESTMTTATASTTTSTPTPTDRGNYTYQGCYVDNKYGGRILIQQAGSDQLTIESCIQTCVSQGLSIAGMEYSTQCFCGNSMVNGGALASADSDCAMTCGGNQDEVCGGPDRVSVYSTGNFSQYGPPRALNTTLPGNWTYRGCLADNPQPRVLPYQIDLDNNLGVLNCLNLCAKYGYSAASMEYGQQCFCGDDFNRLQSGAAFIDAGQCNTPCPAQPEALCGGANAMNYYTWDGLYQWANASGDAAGQYQFLIGGVVIPLITTVGVNKKVTFVEKHGTGPPNSTGAYELDLSQVNDFSKAWRTMSGLRTDVFCSAGLTLPDKSGRQINIGGWSADSLFGVRFYLPDGSEGVAGNNDWEESVEDVHLQVGRWYPTALQLVNGSILVVGGEDGSNGKPVPNLEIIPTPPGGPVLHMDWLERTDPNNLYPFLTVLPSGNIGVFYYNEARIVSESTFETIRTLPQIPGAVNNELAGRTYPMEGTMMILPQYAPYTDPLGVLICGGSTPYQGIALDNCVTILPEVPGANWTIERMPSKRVMSCMAALPDGTYLILNGAHQGLAGFGLASDPNHDAVLYDPSKPLNQRMTSMASTTIDRLYHSEAILLPDGRVLVSGSDPEDNLHAQEYRVEVFVPPYLMGGLDASRPSYTISDKDWSYGETISITITSGDVSKISLMGAVSSTHGHSMGQRTIFPSFSCYGSGCTITAPPNGHVTGGPGWFMLFVVTSRGTPSLAEFVRIGGDPAGLGNWPDTGDFTLPGM